MNEAKPASGCTDPSDYSLSDTDRLVWLRRNVSGAEMRQIGICMDNTGDTDEFRRQIDKVIIANAQGHVRPCSEAKGA